jgi:hypothetical protein
MIAGKTRCVKSLSGKLRRAWFAAGGKWPIVLACITFLLSTSPSVAASEAKRVVVLKVDGLPHDTVERFVHERDPRTGKSLLPWIEHIFYERGTRVANFYVRGMSLSGPAWSLLDTGRHLQIKGNVEFDRYTLHSYDYLNFIPFWIGNVGGVRVDMPGVELMDEMGIPLLADAYPYDERYIGFQLFQRGTRWTTLERGLKNFVSKRDPQELFDEWQIGISGRDILYQQLERELIQKLNDPKIRYLDLYTTDFDHTTHHNRDRASHLHSLRELDALIGRVWGAIQKTPVAAETALVLVSDHGTNSDERIYSQGYNLVKMLGSAAGGGHHVVTKRRLLSDYSLKSIYPLIPLIYTTTEDSYYLKGQSTSYPTAIIDFDGNERASIHLRDSDLNLLHILLLQLKRKELPGPLRRAATAAFFLTLERRRPAWQKTLGQLHDETGALGRLIESQRKLVEAQPKKWTKEDRDAGRDRAARRLFARYDSWSADEREMTKYTQTLSNLLALRPGGFDPSRILIKDVIAAGAMGDHNSIYELQNYVIGAAPGGLALAPDGSLDNDTSFLRIDYFTLLGDLAVRNNVQPGVATRPVDFVAVRVPVEAINVKWDEPGQTPTEVFWLHGGRARQALILARTDETGRLWLRYLPVKNLRQDANGLISFERAEWRDGFPLKLWEDPQLEVPAGESRESWLGSWHTDLAWLRAAHLTKYSNSIVGLHEQLARHPLDGLDASAPGISEDERLIRRLRQRQRLLVENDLLILANDHWNFDVRGFNPGGNHGSFFRVSTHATLMFSGGAKTGIPQNLAISEPYDSLSFMPTILALTRQLHDGQAPVPILWQKGFRNFPGRLIEELLRQPKKGDPPVADKFSAEVAP